MSKGLYLISVVLCFFGSCIFPVAYCEINSMSRQENASELLVSFFLPSFLFALPVAAVCSMLPSAAPMAGRKLVALWIVVAATFVVASNHTISQSLEEVVGGSQIAIFALRGLRFTLAPSLLITTAIATLNSIKFEEK